MGRITKAVKEVTQGARALEKVAKEAEGAAKKAEEALQRAAKTTEKTAGETQTEAKKVTEPGTGTAARSTKRKYSATYKRPSGYRKGVRDKVWGQTQKESTDGNVRDPLTKTVMAKHEPWDMGHKPGYEFRKHQASAAERGIDRKQFLDEHNDPGHYWPELPSSNQSHQGEDHTDDYFGP